MRIRAPLLWLALLAMWLVLNGTLAPGQVTLGALAALAGVLGLAALQPGDSTRLRRPSAAVALAGVVFLDVVRSNAAVAVIVLRRGTGGRRAGFVDIPLEIRHPAALATLACIVTSTPGTSWASYDRGSGVLTMHILDLVDDAQWVQVIKERYERRLMAIFE
jgi:multicomponent K+:H+ antiporter subunit E